MLPAPGQCAAFSVSVDPRNPQELAIASATGVSVVTSGSAGKSGRLLPGTQDANDAQFSPDGTELVTAGQDGNVDIYKFATSTVVATLSAGETDALTATFSPDGRHIVAGYSSGTGRVWDIATKLQLTLLAGHNDQINSAQFSPNGTQIVTGSGDGTIRIWYAEPRELQTEITMPTRGSALAPVLRAGYVQAGSSPPTRTDMPTCSRQPAHCGLPSTLGSQCRRQLGTAPAQRSSRPARAGR